VENNKEENTFPAKEAPRVIIACRVMKPEIDSLVGTAPHIELRYLDASLHETPDRMPQLIQDQIDEIKSYASQIVLGYGLCSNGIVGLKAPMQGLIIPRAHDCITLFLGSRIAYDTIFKEKPGTYYLTAGWVEERKDPLGYMEHDWIPKMGRKLSEWGLKEELKNYTHIALIKTKFANMEPLRKVAKSNARFLEKKYEEIPGLPDYFKKIIFGPYLEEDFICLKPGETMLQEMIVGYP
jgi:hypothetical protein